MLRSVVMISTLRLACCLLAAVAAACAQHELSAPRARYDSVVPGTIGIALAAGPDGVVISAVGESSAAAAAGVRVGDVVLRYGGVSVAQPRQLYGLMLDSAPGSTVEVELRRDGAVHRILVPIEQIDTASRA